MERNTLNLASSSTHVLMWSYPYLSAYGIHTCIDMCVYIEREKMCVCVCVFLSHLYVEAPGPEFDGLLFKFFDGHFLNMYVI